MADEIRCSIELRTDETRQSPGRIVGTMLTYGKRAQDRPEVFERGSLTWPESGIVLNRQHDRRSPILRVVPIVDGDEVRINAPLLDTQAGRDCATEIRAGLFTGLSIEFNAKAQTFSGGVRRISAAVLKAVGLVDSPSHVTAVEVREKGIAKPGSFLGWL